MSIISAGTTSTTAFKVTSDTTGSLLLKTGASGATAIDIDAAQVVSIGNIAVTGGTINNTIIGGTTAAAGTFTTLTAASTVTLNGGTANGVAYLNGSKNLTTGTALTFDGTNLAPDGTSRNLGTSSLRWGTVYATAFADGSDQLVGSSGTTVRWGYGSSWTAQAFAISGSEQMRLTSTGLGIGTNSPTAKLHVWQTGAATSLNIDGIENPIFAARYAANADGATIFLAKSRNATVGSQTIVQNGDELGVLKARGSNGTGFQDAASISFFVDGAPGASNDMPGRIVFGTSADGTASITERARIDASGNFFVGRTTTNGFGSASVFITKGLSVDWGEGQTIGMPFSDGSGYFNGMVLTAATRRTDIQAKAADGNSKITFSTGSTPSERARIHDGGSMSLGSGLVLGSLTDVGSTFYIAGSVLPAGAGTHFLKWSNISGQVTYDSSSRLLKENIEESPYGLAEIMRLKSRKYFRTDDQRYEIGFVADEVYEVLPEFVPFAKKELFTKNAEDQELIPGGVHYDKLTSVLVKAIQELKAELDAAKAEIDALKGLN